MPTQFEYPSAASPGYADGAEEERRSQAGDNTEQGMRNQSGDARGRDRPGGPIQGKYDGTENLIDHHREQGAHDPSGDRAENPVPLTAIAKAERQTHHRSDR